MTCLTKTDLNDHQSLSNTLTIVVFTSLKMIEENYLKYEPIKNWNVFIVRCVIKCISFLNNEGWTKSRWVINNANGCQKLLLRLVTRKICWT